MFKENKRILIVLLCCVSFFQNNIFAQNISTKASIQPLEIPIGQQAVLQIDVTAPKGSNVIFPIYKDTLVAGLEVLTPIGIDTTYTNGMENLSLKYAITSFDSAVYKIPYIPVIVGVDTFKTNDLALEVTSPQLTEATLAYIKEFTENKNDTIPNFEKLGISNIKPILQPPFVWQDYLLYVLIGLLGLVVLLVIILVIYFLLKKKKKGYMFKPQIVLPPHIIALNELDTVKEEKLWQQGRDKQYYTSITDILREYIENRFGINAFEMTSDEILAATHYILENDSSQQSLKQILKLSDLVKFAKYTPLPNENDLSMMNAYLFVNQTKKEDITPVEQHDDENKLTSKPKAVVNNSKTVVDDKDDDDNIDWSIRDDNNTPLSNIKK